jgi:hypothetical protein
MVIYIKHDLTYLDEYDDDRLYEDLLEYDDDLDLDEYEPDEYDEDLLPERDRLRPRDLLLEKEFFRRTGDFALK